jgi:hypothetical protein
MSFAPGRWWPLTPETAADLPEAAGVFEVANLVRTVLYIGRGEGSVRARLGVLAHPNPTLPRLAGGYYFRYELGASEEELHATRLAEYCAGHGGHVPLGNRETARPLRMASLQAA